LGYFTENEKYLRRLFSASMFENNGREVMFGVTSRKLRVGGLNPSSEHIYAWSSSVIERQSKKYS